MTARAWPLAAALPQRVLMALVHGYRLLLKPWLGNACRFEPTCSAYALQALERHGALVGSTLAAGRVLRCNPWCDGGCDPVPGRRRPACSRDSASAQRDTPPRQQEAPMTDMRRTLLWVVFTMSLVLLWDKWNMHTGQPSMFGGTPRPAATGRRRPARLRPRSAAGVPLPSAAACRRGAGRRGGRGRRCRQRRRRRGSEKITLTTDVVKATFDSQGGTLVRLELLATASTPNDRSATWCCSSRTPSACTWRRPV